MPLRFQLSQILKLTVIQSTLLVPLTIIGGGIASGEYFKALFYALGILILGPIQQLVAAMIGHSRMKHGHKTASGTPLYSSACDMFAVWAGSDYTCPAWSSTLLAFSFTYLIVPMGINLLPNIEPESPEAARAKKRLFSAIPNSKCCPFGDMLHF